ncbi:MAG: RecX family transcriptional regulator [Clostridia bacterium]|nr:RecX family transcriptional regulator [Clostridia bacterium]
MTYTIAHVYETRAGISVEIACNDGNENNKTLLFKPSFWLEENLSAGDTIDEDRLNGLQGTADLCCAVARAESLLASSDYSRRRLIVRLMHYNHEQSVCEAAADYMVEHGYINEEEQTKRITKFYCQRKHWGKKRIAAELMGRGYDRKIIFAALGTVSDEDYYKSLMKLIWEKYSEPAKDRHENDLRIAAISRMGYSTDEIIRALNEAKEAYEDAEDSE